MDTRFIRTQMLLGEDAMERLAMSRVAVFGLGGVGGHVVEALARTGIGALDLIDNDTVALSNLNRQIIATENTLGELKTEAAKARVLSVNPNCRVTLHNCFFLPENADTYDFSAFDYVVDAIDTVSGKLAIIEKALAAGSCGGSSKSAASHPSRLSGPAKRLSPRPHRPERRTNRRAAEEAPRVQPRLSPAAQASSSPPRSSGTCSPFKGIKITDPSRVCYFMLLYQPSCFG